MKISFFQLQLAAALLKQKQLYGFKNEETDLGNKNAAEEKKAMLACGMLQKKGSTYGITPEGKQIVETVCSPDAWIKCENKDKKLTRLIFVKDIDYLCAELKENDMIQFTLLPILTPAIGAYAEVIRGVKPAEGDFLSRNADEGIPFLTVEGEIVDTDESLDMEAVHYPDGDFTGLLNAEEWVFKGMSDVDCVNHITYWLLTGLKKKENENG